MVAALNARLISREDHLVAAAVGLSSVKTNTQ
jgi:hypothetical protein